MNMNAQMIFWVAALIVFLIAEGITVSLVSLWFVGGALAAFLVSFATQNFWIQIAVFLGVSIVLLLLLRPLAVRFSVKEKDRITTGANGLVGKRALVTEEIDNLRGTGQAKIDGMEWTARSEKDEIKIPVGANAKVLSVSGVKLIVTPVAEEK